MEFDREAIKDCFISTNFDGNGNKGANVADALLMIVVSLEEITDELKKIRAATNSISVGVGQIADRQ